MNTERKPFIYKKAHLHLIRHVLDLGCSVSVFDGEEWQAKKSTSFTDIKNACECVDESHLHIFNAEGEKLGIAFVVLGNEPEELVCDHSDNKFMNDWYNKFDNDFNLAQ